MRVNPAGPATLKGLLKFFTSVLAGTQKSVSLPGAAATAK